MKVILFLLFLGIGNDFLENQIIVIARSYRGTSYQWGGESVSLAYNNNIFLIRKKLDCSSFVQEVYRAALSIDLPRTAKQQWLFGSGIRINKSVSPKTGDLVFFNLNPRRTSVSHVGIVSVVTPDGQIRMIHASYNTGKVEEEWLPARYYSKIVGFRRLI